LLKIKAEFNGPTISTAFTGNKQVCLQFVSKPIQANPNFQNAQIFKSLIQDV